MGTQFRKSKKFGPVRVGISKRGLSTSVGVKGARIGIGADGKVRRTVGIPGTGIYNTKTVGGGRKGGSAGYDPAQEQARRAEAVVGAQNYARELVTDQTPEQQKAIYDAYLEDQQDLLLTIRNQLIEKVGESAHNVDSFMPYFAQYMDSWTGLSGTQYVPPSRLDGINQWTEKQKAKNAERRAKNREGYNAPWFRNSMKAIGVTFAVLFVLVVIAGVSA